MLQYHVTSLIHALANARAPARRRAGLGDRRRFAKPGAVSRSPAPFREARRRFAKPGAVADIEVFCRIEIEEERSSAVRAAIM
jgi:hypothetical protein